MTNTNTIREIVRSHNGIKMLDIANELGIPHNTVSGTLSHLKYIGIVFNEDSKWYATNSVHTIKQTLNEIHVSLNMPLDKWAEGYVSALADHNIINENEFNELIEYIKK